jgi:hypothetical protein
MPPIAASLPYATRHALSAALRFGHPECHLNLPVGDRIWTRHPILMSPVKRRARALPPPRLLIVKLSRR